MTDSPRDLKWLWLTLVASVCIAALAITNESLWMDEAHTAYKAAQPDIQGLHSALLEEGGSDINMPLYMVFVWLWGKCVGVHPEWLLRASNLIWYALLQVTLLAALRSRLGIAFWCALTFSFCPFIWFYLNEARPYIMQLAGAVLVASFFLRRFTARADGELGWTCALGAGLLVICGSSLVGVLWAGAVILLLGWFVWRTQLMLNRRERTVLIVSVALLAGLGAYYVNTLFFQHLDPPSPGKTGFGNAIFALYELLGLAGLGPGRDAIRTNGLGAFKPYASLLIFGGLILFGLLLAGLLRLHRKYPRLFWPLVLAWIVPVAGVLALGALNHTSVLGRHLTPALPPLLLLLGWTLARLWMHRHTKAVACVAFLPFLMSSGMLRFAERHAKTDVRAGIAAARSLVAASSTVWWVGDQALPLYYLLPISRAVEQNPGPILVRNPSADELMVLPTPQAIFLLRPDAFDRNGAAQDFIRAQNYRRDREWKTLSLWRATPPARN